MCEIVSGPPRRVALDPVSYTHLRAHETPEHLVCRLLLEKKNNQKVHIVNYDQLYITRHPAYIAIFWIYNQAY